MIDLYFWPTPNGYKPLIFLEETGLPYQIKPINILRGEQFQADFLEIAPNNRIPAIVDHSPAEGNKPLALFESGSILIYLAEKADQFLASDLGIRHQTIQWLMWQMGGIGPMMGQANHFTRYAPEDIPYAKKRYVSEVKRLLGVMEKRLSDREYLTGDYSIADMACYPWIKFSDLINVPLADFPRVAQWVTRISERPAVKRAYEVGEPIQGDYQMDEEARRLLFDIKPNQ
ncbi:MAG: thiol:disulfide oxidoreductase [Microcystis sp. Msp_OC_L_20101000_S702]|jgi:GST-like protein|uniref:Thiol:disulfide oxidoreductase n=1 Tax=Microcystis aeruginosa Ma_QC_B_20070730_S2 TaxID=2486256 RepID=A0A552DA43_MICAE|nr:glutathione binding-like protein [Microcystis sp. Msp_OC_L_20101000_S702]TRU04784.1 MAG: thiol:disulfide oxidoreductase [Microcystis sp. Msp_OC_L_20101000_S702]TRU19082.1 MAG: thiol:disulfide oxidoreductase [Microcystis aeruginosa Ma_QC_B_20070730_S2]